VNKVKKSIILNYPNYIVYSDGTVISNDPRWKNPRVLKPWIDQDGYRRVHLVREGKKKGFSVAVLVLSSFTDRPSKKHTVNHINGIKADDRLENLEWATRMEQIQHAFKMGLKTGYEQGKLKPDDVRVIRRLLADGSTQKEIGLLYNVHPTTIGKIASGVNWSHVK